VIIRRATEICFAASLAQSADFVSRRLRNSEDWWAL